MRKTSFGNVTVTALHGNLVLWEEKNNKHTARSIRINPELFVRDYIIFHAKQAKVEMPYTVDLCLGDYEAPWNRWLGDLTTNINCKPNTPRPVFFIKGDKQRAEKLLGWLDKIDFWQYDEALSREIQRDFWWDGSADKEKEIDLDAIIGGQLEEGL